MTRQQRWRWVFLAATAGGLALPIALEIWAATDRSVDTETWTELTVRYVPWQAIAAAFGAAFVALGVWLPLHFRDWYRRRRG